MANLYDMIDATEGVGNYSTLFSHSQRPGGAFEGTDVSKMTLGELRDFSTGPYANWSKGKLGYTATPMGRYQIVGQTQRGLQDELGFDDNTVFSPEVQDQMALALIKQTGGDPARLKGTWEGLKNYSDDELRAAYGATTLEGGPGMDATLGDDAASAVNAIAKGDRTKVMGPWEPPEREEFKHETTDYIGAGLMGLGSVLGGESPSRAGAITAGAMDSVRQDHLDEQDRLEKLSRQVWEDDITLDDKGYERDWKEDEKGYRRRKDAEAKARQAALDAESAADRDTARGRAAWQHALAVAGEDRAIAAREAAADDPYSTVGGAVGERLDAARAAGIDLTMLSDDEIMALIMGKYKPADSGFGSVRPPQE